MKFTGHKRDLYAVLQQRFIQQLRYQKSRVHGESRVSRCRTPPPGSSLCRVRVWVVSIIIPPHGEGALLPLSDCMARISHTRLRYPQFCALRYTREVVILRRRTEPHRDGYRTSRYDLIGYRAPIRTLRHGPEGYLPIKHHFFYIHARDVSESLPLYPTDHNVANVLHLLPAMFGLHGVP